MFFIKPKSVKELITDERRYNKICFYDYDPNEHKHYVSGDGYSGYVYDDSSSVSYGSSNDDEGNSGSSSSNDGNHSSSSKTYNPNTTTRTYDDNGNVVIKDKTTGKVLYSGKSSNVKEAPGKIIVGNNVNPRGFKVCHSDSQGNAYYFSDDNGNEGGNDITYYGNGGKQTTYKIPKKVNATTKTTDASGKIISKNTQIISNSQLKDKILSGNIILSQSQSENGGVLHFTSKPKIIQKKNNPVKNKYRDLNNILKSHYGITPAQKGSSVNIPASLEMKISQHANTPNVDKLILNETHPELKFAQERSPDKEIMQYQNTSIEKVMNDKSRRGLNILEQKTMETTAKYGFAGKVAGYTLTGIEETVGGPLWAVGAAGKEKSIKPFEEEGNLMISSAGGVVESASKTFTGTGSEDDKAITVSALLPFAPKIGKAGLKGITSEKYFRYGGNGGHNNGITNTGAPKGGGGLSLTKLNHPDALIYMEDTNGKWKPIYSEKPAPTKPLKYTYEDLDQGKAIDAYITPHNNGARADIYQYDLSKTKSTTTYFKVEKQRGADLSIKKIKNPQRITKTEYLSSLNEMHKNEHNQILKIAGYDKNSAPNIKWTGDANQFNTSNAKESGKISSFKNSKEITSKKIKTFKDFRKSNKEGGGVEVKNNRGSVQIQRTKTIPKEKTIQREKLIEKPMLREKNRVITISPTMLKMNTKDKLKSKIKPYQLTTQNIKQKQTYKTITGQLSSQKEKYAFKEGAAFQTEQVYNTASKTRTATTQQTERFSSSFMETPQSIKMKAPKKGKTSWKWNSNEKRSPKGKKRVKTNIEDIKWGTTKGTKLFDLKKKTKW